MFGPAVQARCAAAAAVDHSESIITTLSQQNKAARGSKRVCQACGVRFYDLARDPIVCPACAVEYTVVSNPAEAPEARASAFSSKTSWRSRTARQRGPVPVYAPEEAASEPSEDVPVEEEDAPVAEPAAEPEGDLVLEHDTEDADYTELIDPAVIEPKES